MKARIKVRSLVGDLHHVSGVMEMDSLDELMGYVSVQLNDGYLFFDKDDGSLVRIEGPDLKQALEIIAEEVTEEEEGTALMRACAQDGTGRRLQG